MFNSRFNVNKLWTILQIEPVKMRHSAFWLSISFLLCLRGESPVSGSQSYRQRDGLKLSQFDSDFENGRLDPWIEESQSGVQWKIENTISPWDLNNKAPPQLNGTSYLRVNRGANFKFGIAILRSPVFSLSSSGNDISFSFSFWIRSKWPQFTNLELYLAENGNERLLLNLYNYSVVTNEAWKTQSISLVGQQPSSTFTLVFYAYCGTDFEDAVAIDDIRFVSNQSAGTETTSFNPTVSTKMTDAVDTNPTTLSSITISSSSTTASVEETTTSTITTSTTTSTTTPTTTPTTMSSTTTTPTTTSTITETSTVPTTSTTTTLKPTTTTTTSSSTTTTTATSTSTTTTTTKVPTTTALSFKCPDTLQKKYPVPDNPCNGKYYQCSGGIATLMDCQSSLIFNTQRQLCMPCSLVLTCVDECFE